MATRKIIICFDGTGNEVGDRESNILRLYKGLTETQDQIVHYVPGIGTLEGPRLILWEAARKLRSLAGLAFGLGLENDVLDAYAFLSRTYQSAGDKSAAASARRRELRETAKVLGLARPQFQAERTEADQIYIFGFSRGAYAARILAGFLNNFGLLAPEKLHIVTEAFRAYRSVTEADRDTDPDVVFRRLRQYHDAFSPRASVPIRALGLFDTVASMARFSRPLRSLRRYGSVMDLAVHANVLSNPSVRIVLQALALDERRTMYRPLPWQRGDYYGNRFKAGRRRDQIVTQRWFPGYHSDIGGTMIDGIGIGQRTMAWMLDALAAAEARADAEDATDPGKPLRLNQAFRDTLPPLGPPPGWTPGCGWEDPLAMAPLHPSLTFPWQILEWVPKTRLRREWPAPGVGPRWYLPRAEPRRVPEDHEVDASVFARKRGHSGYRPENLPERHQKT
ncbi:T6SS phospholipase effector Tle1-like catalytic domain-containing protein [Pseudodonghicola xiamenensis]|uniref:T6SS Phospholipase effector Tle1-like catalytic domain-containing protein n=1 Tax=Pseudodonghicola xiamenensis TaxID=337702 RepID=A0A8J3MCY1_9RHOB|nr:DUF2235 domain-containing protein [Pseudodonghicola xiamenensis]GHG94833.1 hypothetical protein GCM10010961_28130 [Pseudodonghicola xiamenensis]